MVKAKAVNLFSFAANLILLAVVACLLHEHKPVPPPPVVDQTAVASPPVALVGEVSEPAKAPPEVQPFRWSQLEAADYPTYIANLRAIGCPERTLADIITADVDGLYAPKRRQIDDQERLLAADTRTERPASRQALEDERQKLWREETDLIARLLHGQTSGPDNSQQPAAVAASTTAGRPAGPSLPLAFTEVDTNTLNLTPRQQSLINGLRVGFTSQLGGLDPNSREYAESWQKAQPEADRILKLQLGSQAYQQLQMQARRKAASNPPSQ